jgi:homoserine dehydrogenase
MKSPKVIIIGAGNIGSELHKRIKQLKWEVLFVVKQDGIYKNFSEKIDEINNIEKYIKNINLAFIAIPTLDDGLTAYKYLKMFLENNIPTITCEKGALGNYFFELEKYLPLIGYSATVGGGTRILEYIKERITQNTKRINLVLNGTLNYIFYQLSQGKKLEEVISEVQRLGYSEPGAKNAIDIINKEASGDIPFKVSILFNIAKLSPDIIKAKDLSVNKILEEELRFMVDKAEDFRYFVSMTKEKPISEKSIGRFAFESNGWYCLGGFRKVKDDFIGSLKGVANGVEIEENGFDGVYCLSGPGAGAGPTVSSMIKDAQTLCDTNKLYHYAK